MVCKLLKTFLKLLKDNYYPYYSFNINILKYLSANCLNSSFKLLKDNYYHYYYFNIILNY